MAKSRSLNRVQLIGNLTRDPILRKSSNGVLVSTFGIATNTNWKDSEGESQERAEFHNIVAFNKLAEICAQVLAKGMLVFVEGELRTRVKESEDGKKYYKTEIKINDMVLLNDKDKSPIGIEAAMEDGSGVSSTVATDAPEEFEASPAESDSFDDKKLF